MFQSENFFPQGLNRIALKGRKSQATDRGVREGQKELFSSQVKMRRCNSSWQCVFFLPHAPASVFFQIFGQESVQTDQLGAMFTPRPNGWPAPLTVLKAGSPVGGREEREQSSGRGDREKTKEQMAKRIIEEIIIGTVFEGGAEEESMCDFLPEQAKLDLPGGGCKKVMDGVLHSQDGDSTHVS